MQAQVEFGIQCSFSFQGDEIVKMFIPFTQSSSCMLASRCYIQILININVGSRCISIHIHVSQCI